MTVSDDGTCNGHSDFDGWAVFLACDVHQSSLGFNHDIVAWSLGVWPCLSITCTERNVT